MKFRSCLVVAVVMAWLMVPARAALRSIPPAAAVTVMTVASDGSVALGKRVFQLSPGAQIRDADNRVVLPVSLRGRYIVRVLLDADGQLERAWILTDEEAAQPAPKF